MRSAFIRSFAIIGLVGAAAGAATAAPLPEQFVLPNHGTLTLNVPSDWTANVKTPAGNSPQTILISPKKGAAFQVLLTPIWGDATRVLPDDAKIHSVVMSAAKGAESASLDKAVLVRNISGPSTRGYYFYATDKAPSAGQWKYVRQGTIATGDIVLTFTILTNDGQQANAKTALDMIRHASHEATDSVLAASR
jgi:hypothetical protein